MSADQLTPLQLAVMEVLWTRTEATVAEVQAALDRDLALTTVGTLLTRLARQGVVARRREGRTYVYRPAVTQRTVRRSMTGRLLDHLFGGDPAALVSHLLREDELSAADLDRLRARLDALDSGDALGDDPAPPDASSTPTDRTDA